MMPLRRTENAENVHISSELSAEREEQAHELTCAYEGIFSDVPGRTDLAECDLWLTDSHPIQIRQYPLPFAVRQIVEEEVGAMLEVGIVEKSQSAYNFPVIVVKKRDETHRLCIDFRRLNKRRAGGRCGADAPGGRTTRLCGNQKVLH